MVFEIYEPLFLQAKNSYKISFIFTVERKRTIKAIIWFYLSLRIRRVNVSGLNDAEIKFIDCRLGLVLRFICLRWTNLEIVLKIRYEFFMTSQRAYVYVNVLIKDRFLRYSKILVLVFNGNCEKN